MIKKLFIAVVFSACYSILAAQSLKIITPKIELWDLSPTAKDIEPPWEFYSTTSWSGCSWYCGGGPDTVYASSPLPDFKEFRYEAINAHDFDVRTAWVEGLKGYGLGEKISFVFAKNSPPVTTVKIYNGYMKSEKAWTENSRVRTLKMYVNNEPYALLQLQDIIGEQKFLTDTLIPDIKNPLILSFEIYDVYPGSKYDETAISEINFDGTGVHCFAAGTLVTMADGTQKPIETIKMGDDVLTYNFTTKTTQAGKVLAMAAAHHHNMVQLQTSHGTIQVTNHHLFYVQGKGWCAINPYGAKQYANMAAVQALQTGDKIQRLILGELETAEILSIQMLDIFIPTYTITSIDGGTCFFANGMLVATEEIP